MPGGMKELELSFRCLIANIRIEAVIFRVGGGRVAPLVAQITSMDCFIGGFKDLMVIHHTGMP